MLETSLISCRQTSPAAKLFHLSSWSDAILQAPAEIYEAGHAFFQLHLFWVQGVNRVELLLTHFAGSLSFFHDAFLGQKYDIDGTTDVSKSSRLKCWLVFLLPLTWWSPSHQAFGNIDHIWSTAMYCVMRDNLWIYGSLFVIQTKTENHCKMHFKVTSPSLTTPPSAYTHHVHPRLKLGPAAGQTGELVARPLPIQLLVADVEPGLISQPEYPSFTSRNLSSFPSTFLYTGRPELHSPTSNLLKSVNEFSKNCLSWWGFETIQ